MPVLFIMAATVSPTFLFSYSLSNDERPSLLLMALLPGQPHTFMRFIIELDLAV